MASMGRAKCAHCGGEPNMIGTSAAHWDQVLDVLWVNIKKSEPCSVENLCKVMGTTSQQLLDTVGQSTSQLEDFLMKHPSAFTVFQAPGGKHTTSIETHVACIDPITEDDLTCLEDILLANGSMTLNSLLSHIKKSISIGTLKRFLLSFPDVIHLDTSGEHVRLLNGGTVTISGPSNEMSYLLDGLEILCTALSSKGPLPIKRLVGYIHVSKSNIREIVGNTEKKLETFVLKYPRIFLLSGPDKVVQLCPEQNESLDVINQEPEKVQTSVLQKDFNIPQNLDSCLDEEYVSLYDEPFTEEQTHCKTVVEEEDNIIVRDALRMIVKYLSKKGPKTVKTLIIGCVLKAEPQIKAATGKQAKKLLKFLHRYPQLFEVTEVDTKQIVALQPGSEGELALSILGSTSAEGDLCVEALGLIVKTIKTKGPLPVKILLGTIHNARADVRKTAGTNETKLEEFCLTYADILQVSEETKEINIRQ